jgi:hypothetical protein
MHGPVNVKSPNNTSKWHMGLNSTFKGLNRPNGEGGGDSYKKQTHIKHGTKQTNNVLDFI